MPSIVTLVWRCATLSDRLTRVQARVPALSRLPRCDARQALRYLGALVAEDDCLEAVAAAIAQARAHDLSSWDREVAAFAIRRWRTYERRRRRASTSGGDARIADLARGLLEHFDPARMDEPGWQRWTAEAVADVLLRHRTRFLLLPRSRRVVCRSQRRRPNNPRLRGFSANAATAMSSGSIVSMLAGPS